MTPQDFNSIMSHFKQPKAKEIEYYSNCCGAFMGPYFEDTLICPECKEHCGKTVDCDECHGIGSATLRIQQESVQIKCPKCKGDGFVEVTI